MGVMCDLSGLPSDWSKKVISEIIEEGNYASVQVVIEAGTEKGDNYLGQIIRVRVAGTKSDGFQEIRRLVLKLPPSEEALRSLLPISKYYTREVYAYEVLLPYFKKLQDEYNIPVDDRFEYAKCYRASSEESKEFILMEDLSIEGFKMYDRLESFNSEHLKMSVKNLARIHAFSFVIKQKDSKLFDEMVSHVSSCIDFGDHFEEVIERAFVDVVQNIDDEFCEEKLRNFSVGAYEKLKNYLDAKLTAPYNVICHGDSWTNNFLYKYEENRLVDIRTLDWQLIRNASPMTDLAYIFCFCTDEKTRAQVYPEIFDFYYEALRSCLKAMGQDVEKCYPEQVYRNHLKMILPFGLCMAVMALPIILSDRGDAPDIIDVLQDKNKINGSRIISQNCIARLCGVTRDYVKYGLI